MPCHGHVQVAESRWLISYQPLNTIVARLNGGQPVESNTGYTGCFGQLLRSEELLEAHPDLRKVIVLREDVFDALLFHQDHGSHVGERNLRFVEET